MSAPRHPITQRFVPLHLAGDRTRREPPPPVIENPDLVSDINVYGTARVRAVLDAIADGAIEAELAAAERERQRLADEAWRAREAAIVRRVVPCACGCGLTFYAAPGQLYLSKRHKRRVEVRTARALRAFGAAS